MPWLIGLGDGWSELDREAAERLDEAQRDGLSTVQYKSFGQNFQATMAGGTWVNTNLATGLRRPLKLWNGKGLPGGDLVPEVSQAVLDALDAQGGRADGALEIQEQKDPEQVKALGNLAGLKIYVWRTGDWHPLAPRQQQQIKAQLRQGKVVFEVVDRRQRFVIDTTGENGWVQITSTGQRRRMKTGQTHGSNSQSSISSRGQPTPREEEPSPKEGLLAALKTEWQAIIELHDHRMSLGEGELAHAWSKQAGAAGKQDRSLLEQSAADFFLKVDLSRNQEIEEIEWLHYRLMQEQAPSFHAVAQVNELLLTKLKMDPTILKRLVELFSELVEGTEDCRLTPSKMREAVIKWIEAGNSGPTAQNVTDYERLAMELHGDRDEVDGGEEQARLAACTSLPGAQCLFRDDVAKLKTSSRSMKPEVVNEAELEEEVLSYYDFMNIMLVRKKVPIQLYQYDLSGGRIKWIAPLLLGSMMDGVWHTGVVVHDKEYWFGGNIFESEIGRTPFGKPTKIKTIGETMRTRADLWNFIQRELVDEFTPENYDVLTHNCNHFSTAVTMFLMNKNIPDDVLKQPELFMNSWLAQAARPIMNRSLGTFGTDGGVEGGTLRTTDMKQKELEWKDIIKNTLVTYEFEPGWTCIGRVMAKQQETCDVRWLDASAGHLHVQKEVSRLHVHLLRAAKIDAHDARADGQGFGAFNATFQRDVHIQDSEKGSVVSGVVGGGPRLKSAGPADRSAPGEPESTGEEALAVPSQEEVDDDRHRVEEKRADAMMKLHEMELNKEELKKREEMVQLQQYVRAQMSKLDR